MLRELAVRAEGAGKEMALTRGSGRAARGEATRAIGPFGRGGELSAEGDVPRAWAELALLAGPRERRSRWALRVETGPREKKRSWAGLGC